MIESQKLKSLSEVYAMLALMYFNSSRFEARFNEKGDVFELEDQNRSLWNKTLVDAGIHYLNLSTQSGEPVSKYHILPTISGHYSSAKTFEATDWESILSLYNNLLRLESSPIVRLNRIIPLSKVKGPDLALKELHTLTDPELSNYLPYYSTQAYLHTELKNFDKAIKSYKQALELKINSSVKNLIINKIDALSNNN